MKEETPGYFPEIYYLGVKFVKLGIFFKTKYFKQIKLN
jgi:hypothetical protein